MYVGLTLTSFESRWQSHKNEMQRGVHRCRGLQRAFRKYGMENLNFEILEIVPKNCSEKEILLLEQKWWDTICSSGTKMYNGRPTGTGSVFHTEETKKAISKSLRKRNENNPHRKIFSNCVRCGKKHSSSIRNYCRDCFFDIKQKDFDENYREK